MPLTVTFIIDMAIELVEVVDSCVQLLSRWVAKYSSGAHFLGALAVFLMG